MTDKQTDIFFVAPAYVSSPWQSHALQVGIGYLAEQVELAGMCYEVHDIAMDGEAALMEKLESSRPRFVGFSLMSLDAPRHYSLISRVKRRFPQIKTVAGGPHISFVKEAALRDCAELDFGVTHEGEQTLVELLSGVNNPKILGLITRTSKGLPVYTGDRPLLANLDECAFPRYRKFALDRYGVPTTVPIVSSRGCPFACIFCGAYLSLGRKWRGRSAANVAAEIEYWYDRGCRTFHFVDSNLFFSKERLIGLCDLLDEKDIRFSMLSDGMRARDADREMLKKLKRIGLDRVAIGIESANDDILKKIKKGETLDELERCMIVLDDLEISVVGFFIIGLPGETVLHTLRSFRFALKYPNMAEAFFFNANPIEGTEFHAWALENNYLRTAGRDTLQNIGGMGRDILIETPEFPISQRRAAYQLSKLVSLAVRIRFRYRKHFSYLKMADPQIARRFLRRITERWR